MPFFFVASHRAQHTQAQERSTRKKWQSKGIFAPIFEQSESHGIVAAIYKLLYIRNKSIALLCQIASKKLQISFVQNAETLID